MREQPKILFKDPPRNVCSSKGWYSMSANCAEEENKKRKWILDTKKKREDMHQKPPIPPTEPTRSSSPS